MDQIKIGKFIAECRKEKHMTQEQLATILNTTNKSISKWENGHCLPETSLFEPLCDTLDISINELFAGHKIKEDNYKIEADNNLLQMLKHTLYDASDKSITFVEFSNALHRIGEMISLLKSFNTKEDAVNFWIKETQASYETCSNAYDFYIHLFEKNK